MARLGGDELVALFTGKDPTERAHTTVQALTETAAESRFRVGMLTRHAADTRETLIDRLYATVRRS
ncbi:MAG: hypothetical protein WCQ77_10195 [Planctomycetota bacterium]